MIDEAKLMLTDDLVREALAGANREKKQARAKKRQGKKVESE